MKRGIFAKKFGGGQVDISNGDFVFSLTESYLVEDGKITAPLKGVNLIGNGPDVAAQGVDARQRRRALRRHLDLRQGRPERARRRRLPDHQDQRDHRRRHADGLNLGYDSGQLRSGWSCISARREDVGRAGTRAGADVAEARVSEGAAPLGQGSPGRTRAGRGGGLEVRSALRVMRGQQVAVTYTSDLTDRSGSSASSRMRSSSRELSQPDPFAGRPTRRCSSKRDASTETSICSTPASTAIDAARALDMAKRCRARGAASLDKRITNSEGATFARQSGACALVTSGGFRGGVARHVRVDCRPSGRGRRGRQEAQRLLLERAPPPR